MSVEYHQDDSKEWRWTRYDANKNVIGKSSEGYVNKQNCIDNANRVQAATDEVEFYKDAAQAHRWRVTASNGRIVAAAHTGFSTEASAKANAKLNGYS